MLPRAPLLARLRRRSIGAVILFALLFATKLAFATVCMTDGASDMGASAVVVDTDGEQACPHPGGCHCACGHATPLPASALPPVGPVPAPSTFHHYSEDYVALPTPSLLRPPIA
jgi:hypothetical protein